MSTSTRAGLDDRDRAILRLAAEQVAARGWFLTVDVARSVGITAQSVHKRVRRLQTHGLWPHGDSRRWIGGSRRKGKRYHPSTSRAILQAIELLGNQVEEKGIEGSFGWPGWDTDDDPDNTPEWRDSMRATADGLVRAGRWAAARLGGAREPIPAACLDGLLYYAEMIEDIDAGGDDVLWYLYFPADTRPALRRALPRVAAWARWQAALRPGRARRATPTGPAHVAEGEMV